MKPFRILVIIGLVACVLFNNVAYATAISHPSSTPTITITTVHVNQNTATTGDVIFTGLYDLPYTTLPTAVDPAWTADKAFIFQLIDTDNITILGLNTPYPFFASGYRQGVFAFYFPASANMTSVAKWNQPYTIRISENPSLFASPQSWDATISTSSYTTFVTQADNQADLGSSVIALAQTLQSFYSCTLLTSSGFRTVLSALGGLSDGENYFRGAIYGLQAMAPSIYLVQSSPLDYTATPWTTTNFDAYAARFSGTWIGTAISATATQLGLTDQIIASIPILLICLGFVFLSFLLVHKGEPGWIVSCLILIMGALLGWIPLALFANIYQLMLAYLAWMYFGSKHEWVQFFGVIWFGSTLICLIIEGGSGLGATQNTVLNDLNVMSNLNVGGLLGIPVATLTFARGIVRAIFFDYSFYSGAWEPIRYFWLCLSAGLVWDIYKALSTLSAQFIGALRGIIP